MHEAQAEDQVRTTVSLTRWGDSLAIRIPKAVSDALDLHPGDILDIESGRGQIVLRPRAGLSLDDLIAAITPENVHAAEFERFIGAEVW